MRAYEFWNEFEQAPKAQTYEGFRDRMLQLMPGYFHNTKAVRKERRAKALELFNGLSNDQRCDFYRGAYNPTV